MRASSAISRPLSGDGASLGDRDAISAQAATRRTSTAWGEFLARHSWAHFATLTTANEWGTERFRREFLDGWVRRVAWHARNPVPWFAVVENGLVGGRAHLHTLVAGTAHLPIDVLESAWRTGNAQVRAYEPYRGAAFYVAKSIPDGCEWYDLSRRRAPLLEPLPPAYTTRHG